MASNELAFKSAQELSSLIKSKQVSPVEIVQAYLQRIDDLNPKLNAFITVTKDQALERARQAEKDIRGGKYLGPLHGIPYAPKDIFATKGIRTTNGSKVTADWIPDHESTVTDRLQRHCRLEAHIRPCEPLRSHHAELDTGPCGTDDENGGG